MIYLWFCLSSLGFLLSERTYGVSPVIFKVWKLSSLKLRIFKSFQACSPGPTNCTLRENSSKETEVSFWVLSELLQKLNWCRLFRWIFQVWKVFKQQVTAATYFPEWIGSLCIQSSLSIQPTQPNSRDCQLLNTLAITEVCQQEDSNIPGIFLPPAKNYDGRQNWSKWMDNYWTPFQLLNYYTIKQCIDASWWIMLDTITAFLESFWIVPKIFKYKIVKLLSQSHWMVWQGHWNPCIFLFSCCALLKIYCRANFQEAININIITSEMLPEMQIQNTQIGLQIITTFLDFWSRFRQQNEGHQRPISRTCRWNVTSHHSFSFLWLL